MKPIWSEQSIAFLSIVLLATSAVSAQTLKPATLSFTSTVVGTSKGPAEVTLTNSTAGPLTISAVSASGNFSETTNCPLAPKSLAAYR